MAAVIIEPRAVRQFARELEGLNKELDQLTRTIDREAAELGHTWKDARFQQFHKRYAEAMSVLAPFPKQAAAYAEYLERKAALAQKALDYRF